MSDSVQSRVAIGVDVGGTKCAAALVSLSDGQIIANLLRPTEPQRGGAAVLAGVIEMVRVLRTEQPLGAKATAVGVCIAELVDADGRIVSDATISWRYLDVAGQISAAAGLPVTVDADVRAAARGEAHFGAGRAFPSFVYITVGTGIAACLVIDKSPYRGARGLTGTMASSPGLVPNFAGELVAGPPLEQFAAGPAIAARYAAGRADFRGDTREVLALAEVGDLLATTIVSTAGRALGAAIAQLVNLLDPEAVVIGGGLGLAGGLYRRSLEPSLREHIWSDLHRDIPVLSARLGNDAGMVGAALAVGQDETQQSS
jgi:glucokinase